MRSFGVGLAVCQRSVLALSRYKHRPCTLSRHSVLQHTATHCNTLQHRQTLGGLHALQIETIGVSVCCCQWVLQFGESEDKTEHTSS